MSEDLLIRSLKDTQTHMLPYLAKIGLFQCELTNFTWRGTGRSNFGGQTLGQDEAAAENFAKESLLDDYLLRQRRFRQ